MPRQPYTIVGVSSPRAWFERGVELWTPFCLSEAERTDRGGRTYWLVGRLLPDVSLSNARAEPTTLLTGLADEHPRENGELTLEIKPMHQWHYGDERQTVVLLFAAAALLLLIACGNVAHLMVTRLSERGRELSLRAALGAGRGRIARLLMSESLLLTCVGGSLGLALAMQGVALARELLPRALIQKLLDPPSAQCLGETRNRVRERLETHSVPSARRRALARELGRDGLELPGGFGVLRFALQQLVRTV